MEDRQPMSEIIKETLEKIKDIADTKTVIGEPINVIEGTTIIPVSKVNVGAGIGGGEYGSKTQVKKDGDKSVLSDKFGGGGGAGITVTPVAFLVITPDGEAKLLNIGENTGYAGAAIMGAVNGIDAALDKAPDIIDKVKGLLGGKKSKDGKAETKDKAKAEKEITVIYTDSEAAEN